MMFEMAGNAMTGHYEDLPTGQYDKAHARQDGRGIGALLIPPQFEPDAQARKYPQSKDSDG